MRSSTRTSGCAAWRRPRSGASGAAPATRRRMRCSRAASATWTTAGWARRSTISPAPSRSAPSSPEGWNKRATAYYLMGDLDQSLHDCDEVMRRNPHHFGALSGYGLIYVQRGELERALEYFERALAINPNMQGVQQSIELIQYRLGQGRQALDLTRCVFARSSAFLALSARTRVLVIMTRFRFQLRPGARPRRSRGANLSRLLVRPAAQPAVRSAGGFVPARSVTDLRPAPGQLIALVLIGMACSCCSRCCGKACRASSTSGVAARAGVCAVAAPVRMGDRLARARACAARRRAGAVLQPRAYPTTLRSRRSTTSR